MGKKRMQCQLCVFIVYYLSMVVQSLVCHSMADYTIDFCNRIFVVICNCDFICT